MRSLARWLWLATKIGVALGLLLVAGLAVAVYAFPYPVETLAPDQGGPLVVTDRHGTILRSIPAPGGRPGRESWITLDAIPAPAVAALIVSEDENFFDHAGVDPRGVARAAWLDLKGTGRFGGSTLTMQLVRMVDSPGQRRTVWNKVKEAVLAMRLERAMGKREILEQYLNRAYYGNGAYGYEAAAQLYFGKPAAALSVGESTLLAIVPRAPGRYDPAKNLDAAKARRSYVLGMLQEKGFLDAGEVERAEAQELQIGLNPPPFRAPHFVDWVVAKLPPEVRARGGVLKTSLDLPLQERLEHRLEEHVAGLEKRGLGQAGVVVLDTQSGEVLAMVGSADFFEADGQVNITTRRRHPGSALKPFVYALALEAGDNPASIAYDIADVPSDYKVIRLTQKEHGPVRYREALGSSYNLAAVHVLEKIGIERLLDRLKRAGVGDLMGSPKDYGLRMALGSAKVRLVDLASAYGFLAREGKVTKAQPALEVRFADGTTWRPVRAAETQVFSKEVSWLVMDMLSDAGARRPAFGQELPLDELGFRVAAKTGTSRGFADTVAVAVTKEITVAAWGGNFDGEPTQGLIAMKAAAPLVRAGLMFAAERRELTLPARPDDLVTAEVCPLSGKRPGPACPHRKLETFLPGTVPTAECDWHALDGHGHVEVRFPPELAGWAGRRPAR